MFSGINRAIATLRRDLEDATLDDTHLSWSSDRDGTLGTGHLVDSASMSVGTHQVTLKATDSDGQTDTVTIVVNVVDNQETSDPKRGIKALLARHPLVSFFVMAYAFSWIVWAPWVLSEDGAKVLPPALSVPTSRLLLAGGILAGPTLSAFIMTATTEGRSGVRRLLGRLVLWRVSLRWYLFALLGVPLIMVVGTMIYSGSCRTLGPSVVLPTCLAIWPSTSSWWSWEDRCSRK
jgi:hypothetical protein